MNKLQIVPIDWQEALELLKASLDNENLDDLFYCDVIRTQVSALEARVQELEEQVRWIPVSERLPDTRGELGHSTSVLIWNPDCECVFMAVRREDEGWEDWTNGQHKHSESEITHWMPSPEPPSIPPPMPTEGGKEHP